MAAFDEIRLDVAGVAYGTTGGPEYRTQIVEVDSGRESRNATWSQALGVWDIGSRRYNRAELDTLLAFFRARQGRLRGFRYKDWADYKATSQPIGTGDGATTTFQLQRTYTSGAASSVRKITKPVAGTVAVYLNGAAQASGWSVDTTTGIVTFATAPAAGVPVTADFEFDVPVRFDVDQLQARFDAWRESDGEALFYVASLPVRELLL